LTTTVFGALGVLPILVWLTTLRVIFGETGLTFTPAFERVPFAGIFHQWQGRGLFALLVILMLVPTVGSWLLFAREVLRSRTSPLLLAWALNLLVVTFLSHYSYLELPISGRIAIGAVLAGLTHAIAAGGGAILRASLYHVLTFPIYVAGVWLGIRSLIVR
jgi:hypothetical protein